MKEEEAQTRVGVGNVQADPGPPHICLLTPGACGYHVTWDDGLCRCDDEVQGLEMMRVFRIARWSWSVITVALISDRGGRRAKVRGVRDSTIHRWVGGCRG